MNIQTSIEQKLEHNFQPEQLSVVNESHMHSVPVNSETHFKVVLVSASFDKVRKVARHQEVYKVLSDEMAGEVHALALHTYTPEEWEHKQVAPESPNCLGGSKT